MSDASLSERSIEQVRTWIESTQTTTAPSRRRAEKASERLADLLRDPAGLDFTVQFVDRVIRPEDAKTAGRQMRTLSRRLPDFVSFGERQSLRLGAAASRVYPHLVQRRARRTLRRLVSHLVLDANPTRLTASIADLQRDGDRLNLSLLGEAVLGESEAARHLDRTLQLIARTDVDYVSVKVSSIASQLTLWSFRDAVDRVVERLRPLYEAAHTHGTFVNLDMEEYSSVDLTIAAFTRALDAFPELEAGIALQAYMPDSLAALQNLQEWATARRSNGGAPVKVRVVKGANLGMERVESILRGWPMPTWPTKTETDTHYKRLLNWALTPERIENVRISVAGQNLFDIAYAWHLAGDRDVRDDVEFEALLGFDGGPMRAARNDIGPLRLYTPVVEAAEFDVAIAYLVRRLQEAAARGNFLSALPHLNSPKVFDREAGRFTDSVKALTDEDAAPFRTQNRSEDQVQRLDEFVNAPDTDPSTEANRRWAEVVTSRSTYTELGVDTVRINRLSGPATLSTLMGTVQDGGRNWRDRSAQVRSWALHQAGAVLEARRADLIAVMMAETGKTFAEADVEVSEAIDFAHYYADSSLRLTVVDGARFEPAKVTVVTPPWNFPVAIPAGSTLAALAAGSGVILKPAPQSPRCAAILAESLWEAGVPRDALALTVVDEGPLSQALVSHPDVERVILTGSWETAQLFRSWRSDLPLMAETSGKNAIIVTPSADRDRAIADLVRSAFGNAGQKCSAASLAILVGPVGDSERFRRQLVDATTSLVVGPPDDLRTVVGPLVGPAREPLLGALTTLDPGETWLVEPRQLNNSGRLWSPGIKTGVRPGGAFHTTEYFGPVLGVMHAKSLSEAIAWQNGTAYGLTAGLHSLDQKEVNTWLERVNAGNLYVNRHITGAVVQRQPFGGWKRSSVGATAKAGGPNHLAHLGTWHPAPLRRAPADVALSRGVIDLLERFASVLDESSITYLRAAAASDQQAWEREFGVAKDVSHLEVERNVFRYLPTPVTIRNDGAAVDVARVLLSAARAGAPVTVSSVAPLPAGVDHIVEAPAAWLSRVARDRPSRVRLVGSPLWATAEAVGGDPDVAIHAGPVTAAGRVELLPFLNEQAISITNHRYGLTDHGFDGVLPRK